MTYLDLYKERQSVKAKLRKLRLKIDVQQFSELKERERKLTAQLKDMSNGWRIGQHKAGQA